MKTRVLSIMCVVLLLMFWAAFDDSAATKSQAQPPASKPTTASSPATKPAELDFGNGIKLKLVVIPAGKFIMGSDHNESGEQYEWPKHDVTITKRFYMGAYTISQEQYAYVMGRLPNNRLVEKTYPVSETTWFEAMDFCKRVSALTGNKVRLPTEAEWEYACRAGTTTYFYTGNKISLLDANFCGSPDGKDPTGLTAPGGFYRKDCAPVGSYPPNPWGLYEMYGNVPQWCMDWYGNYIGAKETDPKGPKTGRFRITRGGGGQCSAY